MTKRIPQRRQPFLLQSCASTASTAGGWAAAVRSSSDKAVWRNLIRAVIRQRFARDPEFLRGTHAIGPPLTQGGKRDLVDFVFVGGDEPHAPAEVFDRLRWGGQCVYASRSWRQVTDAVREVAEWLEARGWAVERRPVTIKAIRN